MKIFYETPELLKALGNISRTTLWRMERQGDFPRRRQITPNRVCWLASEVEAWAEARPTAAANPEMAERARGSS
ncbi:MAG: helix-turn-helix transcriptional regulator [Alphaproteobacteria bacterium]